ncbi:MAG: right-handed parallel beta-helix repeat-containing protein, partial [Dysgonamonadaceae bacterium]|nr:right-handed parallel beta-helix repeat-containing protein [Dysgonamonadaceae bacterium]
MIRIVPVTLFLLLATFTTDAATRYVTVSGAGMKNGSNWQNAAPGDSLQATVNKSAAGDEIWVAAGTYKPNHTAAGWTAAAPTGVNANPNDRSNAFVLKSEVKVYGGFSGTETALSQRNIAANPTILSGYIGTSGTATDNCNHTVIVVNVANGTLLDGFTVQDGYAASGTAVTVSGKSVATVYGGGIYIDGGSPHFENITVVNNHATTYAGGVFASNTNAQFYNSKIQANTSANGAGISNYCSTVYFVGCLISGNKTTSTTGIGGGLLNMGYASTIIAKTYLINATVSGNVAVRYGGAVNNNTYAQLKVYNSIVYGNYITRTSANTNEDGTDIYSQNDCDVEYKNSLINSIISVGTATETNWGGNIAPDPLFVSPLAVGDAPTTSGDFHLQNLSPAVDKGATSDYNGLSVDLDGQARIIQTKIDLGAYEVQSPFSLVPDAYGIVYVDSSHVGLSGMDGSSWSKAYPDLAYPLLKAAGDGTIREIRVTKGAYYPQYKVAASTMSGERVNEQDKSFVLVKDVKLYGGFASGLPDATSASDAAAQLAGRDFSNDETILSGDLLQNDVDFTNNKDFLTWYPAVSSLPNLRTIIPTQYCGMTRNDNAHHVVVSAGDVGTACLDGFTVSHGYARELKAEWPMPETSNDHTTGQLSQPAPRYTLPINNERIARMDGGGINVTNSSPALKNLVIRNNWNQVGQQANYIAGFGAGMCLEASGSELTNVQIFDNISGSGGGGAYVVSGTPTFRQVDIRNNICCYMGAGINYIDYKGYGATHIVMDSCKINSNYQLGIAPMSGGGGGICMDAYDEDESQAHTNSKIYIRHTEINNNIAPGWGAGIYMARLPYVEFDSCTINHNQFMMQTTDNHYRLGTGIYLFGGNNTQLKISDSSINGNDNTLKGGAGGGAFFRKGTVTLYKDSICGNRVTSHTSQNAIFSSGRGGAFVVTMGANVNAANCVITGNTSSSQGAAITHGLYQNNAANAAGAGSTYTNCLFADNTTGAADNGSVFFDDGNAGVAGPAFLNCTFVGETDKPIISYKNDNNNTVNFLNSILYTNGSGTIGSGTGDFNAFVFKNVLTNQPAGAFGTNAANKDTITHSDPLFVDMTTGNYRLQASSPAIDQGDTLLYKAIRPTLSTDVDLNNTAGVARLQGGQIDIGAYEAPACVTPTLLIANPDPVCSDVAVNLTLPAITVGSMDVSLLHYYTDTLATTVLIRPDSVTVAGKYYIQAESVNGCLSPTKPVTVSHYPAPILTITNPGAVCEGTTVDLTAAELTDGSSLAETLYYY